MLSSQIQKKASNLGANTQPLRCPHAPCAMSPVPGGQCQLGMTPPHGACHRVILCRPQGIGEQEQSSKEEKCFAPHLSLSCERQQGKGVLR